MATILLVEDDPLLADCLARWLQAGGYTVVRCRDAQMAIDAIDDAPPQVILLDLLLPGANGIQLLHTLRSHADLVDIPIILCSSALPQRLPDFAAYGVRAALDKATLTRRSLHAAIKGVL
jgi:DNA-binding response OmpR family regulator